METGTAAPVPAEPTADTPEGLLLPSTLLAVPIDSPVVHHSVSDSACSTDSITDLPLGGVDSSASPQRSQGEWIKSMLVLAYVLA